MSFKKINIKKGINNTCNKSKKVTLNSPITTACIAICLLCATAYLIFYRNSCECLHKVTSRDDLLKQMYDTAYKDDCLFKMTAEELQNIWQVPVSDGSFKKPYTRKQLKKDFSLRLYPNKSPFDFYVYYYPSYPQGGGLIGIALTRDAWRSGKYTLFPEGYFPEFLGEPTDVYKSLRRHQGHLSTPYTEKPDQQIKGYKDYYWKSGFPSHRSMRAGTEKKGEVISFIFRDSLQ